MISELSSQMASIYEVPSEFLGKMEDSIGSISPDIMVSILAFQASDPGSIPGQRNF